MSSQDKSLSIFHHQDKPIRSFLDDHGEPWFVATDVCAVLEHSNSRVALARLDDDEKGVTTVYTLGGEQQVAIINESGLFSLVLTSRKPEAKAFKKWITSEVLPALRKTGRYDVNPPSSPLEILRAQLALMEEQQARLDAHEHRIEAIEDRQAGIEQGAGYFTVLGYVIHNKLSPVDLPTAAAIGREATKLSNMLGYPVGKATDPRFGDVNTYHETILEGVFANRAAKKGKRRD